MVRITEEDESFDAFVNSNSDDDYTSLITVAKCIRDDNLCVKGVKKVQKRGPKSTYVDFETSENGVEWSKTDDFGGWNPVACEAKDDDVYRVWFQR